MTTINQTDLDVARAIGGLEATVRGLAETVTQLRADISADYKPLAARVAKLENWRAWTLGAAAAIGAVVSYAIDIVKAVS